MTQTATWIVSHDSDVMKFTSRFWRPRRRSTATEAAPAPRQDTHRTLEQSPLRVGIDAQVPNSMPRAEDDAITRAGSREFHDRPGSGADIAKREFYF